MEINRGRLLKIFDFGKDGSIVKIFDKIQKRNSNHKKRNEKFMRITDCMEIQMVLTNKITALETQVKTNNRLTYLILAVVSGALLKLMFGG